MTNYRLHSPRVYARGIILTTAGLLAIIGTYSCTYDPQPPVPAVKASRVQTKAARLIDPGTAAAICKISKRPKTMLAIAAVESGKNGPQIIGDHGQSRGIFQIQARHWQAVIGNNGEVADDLEEQVRQADAVFDVLVEAYGYREAVRRWNGKGRQARNYQRKVLAIVASL